MEYHPYISSASRVTGGADRMNVFGPGTDPAGLGTLGAPVNSDHVFDHLGENLPPFGNPRAITQEQGAEWSRGFQDRYSGKIVTETRDRFSPNTTTITITDPIPTVMRDEIHSVKNNAQIAREKTSRSMRTYAANPSANALADQVNADAELRNLQQEAVSMVYESQMDALRAKHAAARSRGNNVRENIGAFMPPLALPTTANMVNRTMLATSKLLPAQPAQTMTKMPPFKPRVPATAASSSAPADQGMLLDTGDIVASEEMPDFETALDSKFDPTKVALVFGGVAVAAAVAWFVMRKR